MRSSYIFPLCLTSALVLLTNASHFFGGTITWHLQNASATGSPLSVVVTQTYSYTYTSATCTSAMIASNSLVPSVGGGGATLSCINTCGSNSAGYSSLSAQPYCTDFSSAVGTTVGQRSDVVNLTAGDNFTIAYQGMAWRPLNATTGNSWSLASEINLTPRSDTGLYNNAPVATVMSPINIPVNQPTVINVPVADPDGDTTRCRWASGASECSSVCPPNSLPPNTTIYPNCTIIITGQNVGDWFAVALMVEDFINSSSTTPMSTVPVQFLVQVVGVPSCTTPPQVVGALAEQSCTSVIVNQTFYSQLIAVNNCASPVTLVDIATLSFSGMLQTSMSQYNATVYYKNLTWTPSISQLGYQVMCAMAFDSQNSQSAQYCFKFYVSVSGVCSCPGEICITTTSTTATVTTTTLNSSMTSLITTISTTKSPDSSLWPIIGTIIGLIGLAALTLICCLTSYYFCVYAPRHHWFLSRTKKFEFYRIERCRDSTCIWNRPPYGPNSLSVLSNSHFANNIVREDLNSSLREAQLRSSTNMRSVVIPTPVKSARRSESIHMTKNRVSPLDDSRVRSESTGNVSVTTVHVDDPPAIERKRTLTRTASHRVEYIPVDQFQSRNSVHLVYPNRNQSFQGLDTTTHTYFEQESVPLPVVSMNNSVSHIVRRMRDSNPTSSVMVRIKPSVNHMRKVYIIKNEKAPNLEKPQPTGPIIHVKRVQRRTSKPLKLTKTRSIEYIVEESKLKKKISK